MKLILGLITLMLPALAGADIYKCLDSHKKVIYQDTPCAAKTMGKVEAVPPLSKEDELRAQRDLERLKEENRYNDQKRREELKQQQEEARRQEALQARESQTEEFRSGVIYVPPSTSHRRHRSTGGKISPPVSSPARPPGPCVPGYVGDNHCM
jgi:thioesterase domain-containing protein